MTRAKQPPNTSKHVIEVEVDSQTLLRNPLLNKGSAFSHTERKQLKLTGLLPHHVSTIEEQVERRYANFKESRDAISKYTFLTALLNRNETLFYRLCSQHIEEMLPFIYTPTVGDASQRFSSLYTHSRGIYISYPLRHNMEEIISQIPSKQVDVVVVTDGGRILGLGDLGVGGMAIPIGKLALYTLFGGIHPAYAVPIVLDVGTNNPHLLSDPLYLGWKHERIEGQAYTAFVDSFVRTLRKRHPHVLLQWEDFSKQHAQSLLLRHRNEVCSFNDDIQGTAGVVMGGIFAAMRGLNTHLKEQTIVIYGGGSAGIGIAELIEEAMVEEGSSANEAKKRIYILGSRGLVHTESEHLDPLKAPFAQDSLEIKKWKIQDLQNISLLETVHNARPTILIGTSAQPGSFTEEVVREMKYHTPRPIIFPLSNPTVKSEAHPSDLLKWTNGEALIATGSPYPPIEWQGREYVIGQCNNVCIFPGVGLGVITSKAKQVTSKMFLEAARILSTYAPVLNDPYASLFPPIHKLPNISKEIALSVAHRAATSNLCKEASPEDFQRAIESTVWKPEYMPIKKRAPT